MKTAKNILMLAVIVILLFSTAAAQTLVLGELTSSDSDESLRINDFVQAVSDQTDGRITIRFYPDGMYASDEIDQIIAMQNGTMALARCSLQPLTVYVPELSDVIMAFENDPEAITEEIMSQGILEQLEKTDCGLNAICWYWCLDGSVQILVGSYAIKSTVLPEDWDILTRCAEECFGKNNQ